MKQFVFLIMWLYLTPVSGEKIEVNFESNGNEAWLKEGITPEIYCHDSSKNIEIRSSSESIVKESNLMPGKNSKYDFHIINSTTCLFLIKRLSRTDDGTYFCLEGEKTKFIRIKVLFSPSDATPVCTSNYGSPVIFDDLRKSDINFTCITENGNPPVSSTLTIFNSNSSANITDIAQICNVYDSFDYIRSFSCQLNESLEDTTFVCEVTQKSPSTHSVIYKESCLYGPLHLLSNFSITISESIVTVNEGDNLTLACSTNVTGVEIIWVNIPKYWKYSEKKVEDSNHLDIYNVMQKSMSVIIVKCIGSYGNRNMTASVKIVCVNKKGKGKVVAIVMTICLILIMCCSIFACIYYARRKKLLASILSSDHHSSEANEVSSIPNNLAESSLNTNNANNTPVIICDEYLRNSLVPTNDQEGEEASTMYDNPAYESMSKLADTMALKHKPDEYAEISKQNQ